MPQRYNKVIGLSLGETSLLAAEVNGSDSRTVRKVAEFEYPAGTSLDQPAALGAALAAFLEAHEFSAKNVAIGLPAKWLIVHAKSVPPADEATMADLLRLQAETEFSSELRDLQFDYIPGSKTEAGQNVLLVATQQQRVDAAHQLCDAAKLNVVAVTSSAAALGAITGKSVSGEAVVLSSGERGTEVTIQLGSVVTALHNLRAAAGERGLTGELRRVLLAMPASDRQRELILWTTGQVDAASLGQQLAIPVRQADWATLGVSGAGADAHRFAPAIATAMSVMDAQSPAVDFLHSRLAPKQAARIPRWAIYVAAAVIALIVGGIYAYTDLAHQQADVAKLQQQLAQMQGTIKTADAFVTQVTFAQAWHSGDARYLACLRDLTYGIPADQQSYATNLLLKETMQSVNGKSVATGTITGTLTGKTSDQERVQSVIDGIKHIANFTEVKLGNTQDAGRGKETSYSITFTYRPPAQSTTQPASRRQR